MRAARAPAGSPAGTSSAARRSRAGARPPTTPTVPPTRPSRADGDRLQSSHSDSGARGMESRAHVDARRVVRARSLAVRTHRGRPHQRVDEQQRPAGVDERVGERRRRDVAVPRPDPRLARLAVAPTRCAGSSAAAARRSCSRTGGTTSLVRFEQLLDDRAARRARDAPGIGAASCASPSSVADDPDDRLEDRLVVLASSTPQRRGPLRLAHRRARRGRPRRSRRRRGSGTRTWPGGAAACTRPRRGARSTAR